VVLYFYPKDCTSGCTKEGVRFKELFDSFRERSAVIYGISADNEDSHKNFIEQHGFPFDLLADTNKVLVQKYGAQKAENPEKIQRSTFLVGADGVVEKIWKPVANAATHPDEVLSFLQKVQH
jgi:peroxiredoxin Q/BCP